MSYKQTIYNCFRRSGLTEAAALAFLGNWQCESTNEPFRLQGDFSPYKTASKAYVQGVTNGSITRERFAKDQKGFGLAQWTYFSRKYALYDYWKASGKALDNAELQTDFALKELREDYKALFDFLKSTKDVFTATSRICREYERPAVNNIDARFQAANSIKYEIDLNAWDKDEPQPEPAPAPEPATDHSLQLRTVDKNCSSFTEVYLLKALLLNRGYDSVNSGMLCIDDFWTEALTEAVKQFQRDFNLGADGVVGPKSWAELLKF